MKRPHEIAEFLLEEYWRVYRDSFFFVVLPMIAAMGLLFLQDQLPLGTAFLWAFAFLSCGSLLGFLFGIPKVSHQQRAAPPLELNEEEDEDSGPVTQDSSAKLGEQVPVGASSQSAANGQKKSVQHFQQRAGISDLRVNTNLERVSDWLTKTLVGVGLIELRELPAAVIDLATFIAASGGAEPSATALSVSGALVLLFISLGFISGYINTRLYFSIAFAKADASLRSMTRGKLGDANAEVSGLRMPEDRSLAGGAEETKGNDIR